MVVSDRSSGRYHRCYLDMAAKLDQTAESICGPEWAIARDLSVYERNEVIVQQVTGSKGKISADRGPPMVSNPYSFILPPHLPIPRSGPPPLIVISPKKKHTSRNSTAQPAPPSNTPQTHLLNAEHGRRRWSSFVRRWHAACAGHCC